MLARIPDGIIMSGPQIMENLGRGVAQSGNYISRLRDAICPAGLAIAAIMARQYGGYYIVDYASGKRIHVDIIESRAE